MNKHKLWKTLNYPNNLRPSYRTLCRIISVLDITEDTEESRYTLESYFKLKEANPNTFLTYKSNLKTEVFRDVYASCTMYDDGIRRIMGRDFINLCVAKNLYARQNLYRQALKVSVLLRSKELLTLADSRKILYGIKD